MNKLNKMFDMTALWFGMFFHWWKEQKYQCGQYAQTGENGAANSNRSLIHLLISKQKDNVQQNGANYLAEIHFHWRFRFVMMKFTIGSIGNIGWDSLDINYCSSKSSPSIPGA